MTDIIHHPHPAHLIFRFQLFGDAFLFRHFFYEPGEKILRLRFDFGKVDVQPAVHIQVKIQALPVLTDKLQMPL